MYKFLVVHDKDCKRTAVFINSIPPNSDIPDTMIRPLKIACEVPLQGVYHEMYKEAEEAIAFQIDQDALLMRSYEFFVLGWNTAARTTVDQKLI